MNYRAFPPVTASPGLPAAGTSRTPSGPRLPAVRPARGGADSGRKERRMSVEENKAIVGRWFTEFWGPDFNPGVIDELAVGQWIGGGTQTGAAFDDMPVGALP